MSLTRPGLALAASGLLLVGSLAFAFHRSYGPDVEATPPSVPSLPVDAQAADVRACPAALQPLLPAQADRVLIADTVSTDRIAALEAEVARLTVENESLRQRNAATQFAARLVSLSAEPLTLAETMRLLDSCDLTKEPELRMHFVHGVRLDAALDLLKAEPKFRSALHRAYSDGTPAWREHEWPAHRDRLVNDFLRHLAEAGLSGRAIELYRVTIADYL